MLNDMTMTRPDPRRVMREERTRLVRKARLQRIRAKQAFLYTL